MSGLLIKRGLPHELTVAWRRRDFILVITEALLGEYEDVLHRPNFAVKYGLTPDEVGAFLRLVSRRAVRVSPLEHLPVDVRDAHDQDVLAAALGGRADYLVTGDQDLLVLRDDPRIGTLRIATVREFLDVLARGEPTGDHGSGC